MTRRPVPELVTLILTITVALILLASTAAVITLEVVDPTIDTAPVVLILSELVAAIIGYLIGQTARRGTVTPDMTRDTSAGGVSEGSLTARGTR